MGDILLSSYIAKNRKDANFTDAELKALKEGNLDNMVSIFVPMKNDKYVQQLQCVLKSMRYYMGEDVSLLQVNLEDNHREHFVGCQMMDGDEEVFFAIGISAAQVLYLDGQEQGRIVFLCGHGTVHLFKIAAGIHSGSPLWFWMMCRKPSIGCSLPAL